VPPAKHEIVGGHLSIWNAGLLTYNLVLAGIDCSQIRIKRYGYNISAIVHNRRITLPALRNDSGDLEILKPYLPAWLRDGVNGDIAEWNW
jgi:hypothetical protein